MNAMEQLKNLARGNVHGGYRWAMVAADGELICETCTRDNYRLIYGATKHSGTDSQWECIGITHSGEADETEACANCNCILWELQS